MTITVYKFTNLTREQVEAKLAIMNTFPIHLPPTLKVTEEQFEQLAAANRDLRLERSATGESIVMPPAGGSTEKRNAKLSAQFVVWNNQTHLGEVFHSSIAFRLPDGAERSSDVSWAALDSWNTLTPRQQETFPVFVSLPRDAYYP